MAYIFLDESGDLGFDPKKQNSKNFVVAILAVIDKRPVEKCVTKVHRALRKKVKKLSGGILHSHKEKPSTRIKLLTLLGEQNISIMTICLNKMKVYTKLQDEKHVLYNYVTNILLDRILSKKLLLTSSQITLIAAKRETNKFLNENFVTYLKTQVKQKHNTQIEVVIKTTAEEKGLQAADFVCWAIFKKYETGDDQYYKIIKERIVEENKLYP